MREKRAGLTKLKKTIEDVFRGTPSVTNWCMMCSLLVRLMELAMQYEERDIYSDGAFLKAMGYLELPPKRLSRERELDSESFRRATHYSSAECEKMIDGFQEVLKMIKEWAMDAGFDEDPPESSQEGAILYRAVCAFDLKKLFKAAPHGVIMSRRAIAGICAKLSEKPVRPSATECYLPQLMSDTENEEREKARERREIERDERNEKFQRTVTGCLGVLASEAVADSPAKKRAGTEGQVSQEDEVLRRTELNGRKGLRSIVAAVLREAAWQLPDGHPNTDRGRQCCYNRVYALMHPARRNKR